MMKDTATVLPRQDPTKENRVILELPIPKPGGHVLSPEFDRVKRWAMIEINLKIYMEGKTRIGLIHEVGLNCPLYL